MMDRLGLGGCWACSSTIVLTMGGGVIGKMGFRVGSEVGSGTDVGTSTDCRTIRCWCSLSDG